MNREIISVSDFVGSAFCVDETDGERLGRELIAALSQSRAIQLSFAGVEMLSTPFCRVSIGELYYQFSEEEVRSLLSLSDISPDNKVLLKFVIDAIKQRLRDPDSYDQARLSALEFA